MPSYRRVGGRLVSFPLGPEQNTFGDTTTANRAAAETLRDDYATANPDWLALYDADRSFLIRLVWIGNATEFQRRNAAGDAWEDTTSAVTGPTGPPGTGRAIRTVRSAEDEQLGALQQQDELSVWMTVSNIVLQRLNPSFLRRLAIREADDQFDESDFLGALGSTSMGRNISYAPGYSGPAAWWAIATPHESAAGEYIERPGDLPVGAPLGSLEWVGDYQYSRGVFGTNLLIGNVFDPVERTLEIDGRDMRVLVSSAADRAIFLIPPTPDEIAQGRLGNLWLRIAGLTV